MTRAKPHTETITIAKRWSWQTALNVEIECDPSLPPRAKLGIAVRVAHETKQDLRGADLRGADLRDADLTGADLTGADLTGADLRGDKIERIFAIAGRLDGHTFYGVQLSTGEIKISAGCRWFTIEQFRAHVATEYPDTDKARETLDIIEFIEKRAVGLAAPQKVIEAADVA